MSDQTGKIEWSGTCESCPEEFKISEDLHKEIQNASDKIRVDAHIEKHNGKRILALSKPS